MISYRGSKKATNRVCRFQINNLIAFGNKRKCGSLRDQKVLISFYLWAKHSAILAQQINFLNPK